MKYYYDVYNRNYFVGRFYYFGYVQELMKEQPNNWVFYIRKEIGK